MKKEVTVCDVCNKQIPDNEPSYSLRYGDVICWCNMDVCQECLSKGLIYDARTSRFKIADADDNIAGVPGERQAY